MRKAQTAMVILVWCLLLISIALRSRTADGHTRTDPLPGQAAPELRAAVDLNGRPVSLGDLKGKAVVLNFWASWCPPCLEEMPTIEHLAKHLPPDTAILTVNLTKVETSPRAVRSFLQASGYSFPVAMDVDGQVAQDYAVLSLPTSVFVSPAGIITQRIAGPLGEAVIIDYLNAAGR
ncbi:MAG TPA: TlpA disulfide reductase family protein [Symbiobacteriaceae bacterium]